MIYTRCCGNFIQVLLEMFSSFQQWKNFEYRLAIGKLIAKKRSATFLWDTVHNVLSCNFWTIFEFNHASQTRGHPYKLYKRHSCISVGASYFANRVINVWSTIPTDRLDFTSFAAFKRTFQRLYCVIIGLVLFLGYCQCHLWPCNPIHTCVHLCIDFTYMFSTRLFAMYL